MLGLPPLPKLGFGSLFSHSPSGITDGSNWDETGCSRTNSAGHNRTIDATCCQMMRPILAVVRDFIDE
jgi:hypothetical protein